MMKSITQILTNNTKLIFWIILLVQLATMLVVSQNVGISADENRHYKQAEKVYNYFKSKGENKAALEKTGIDPMQYNGQSFDNIMYFLEQTFDVKNNMEMRHFFNAILGWLVILITGLIAKELWGYKGAILAIFLIFISPRFIGHALNNNKDIPFAFGFILSFYGTLRFLKLMPKPNLTSILLLVCGIGFAISIRLAGLITIAFLGLFSAIYLFSQKPYFSFFKKEKLNILKKLLIVVPLVVVIGYFIGIALWPFMLEAPIKNIKIVLDATSSHPVSLNQLFDGELIQSAKIPQRYSLKYMILTYPVIVLLGMSLSFLLLLFNLKKESLFNYFTIAFGFVFVFTWMSLKNSNFYGGIRHLLFIYPLAICLAVIGYKLLYNLVEGQKQKWLQLVPVVLIIGLSIHPLRHNIKNYPYSYVYFNELSGGMDEVKDKYETDFFQHSLKHATEWFIENELPTLPKDSNKITVVSNDGFNTKYYLRGVPDRVELKYSRYYEKAKKEWDYAIFYCGYITPSQITDKLWPPQGTIHTEKVDGFPIAAVVKRVSKEDLKGFNAMKKNKMAEAKIHFKKFLAVYPKNEEVLEGYARIMLRERKLDSTIVYADSSLMYNPRQIGAWLLKASALNTQKKYAEALIASNEILQIKEAFGEGYFQKGYALKYLNKPNDALKAFQKATGYKNEYYQAFMQIGEILSNYKQYKKAIGVYNQVFKFKANDIYAIMYSAKCHHLLNDNKKAEELLKSLPARNQNHLEAVKVKCRISISKNDINTAGRLLNMARRVNNNADLFVVRALFVTKQNRGDLAKQYLDKTIELDGTNQEAKALLKSLQQQKTANTAAKPSTQQKPQKQQSIMFQKPKSKKNTSPFKVSISK